MFEKLFIPISVLAISILIISGVSSIMGINPLDQPIPDNYKTSNWKNLKEFDNSQIQDVTKIELNGGVQANVSRADVAYLSGENVKDTLKYIIQDNTLVISFQPKNRLKVSMHSITDNNILNIGLRSVEKLSITGGGQINSSGLLLEKLNLMIRGSGTINLNKVDFSELNTDIDGSGRVNIDGNTIKAITKITGEGQLNGQDLKVKLHEADITGIGQIRTDSEKILIKIVGNGSLEYKGNPLIDQDIKGTGRVYRYKEI